MTNLHIDRCPACGRPAHATESDDDGYHEGCRPSSPSAARERADAYAAYLGGRVVAICGGYDVLNQFGKLHAHLRDDPGGRFRLWRA